MTAPELDVVADEVQSAFWHCSACHERVGVSLPEADELTLKDLLDELGVVDAVQPAVAKLLVCPGCQRTGFELSETVGQNVDDSVEHYRRWVKWSIAHSAELEDFWSHLSKTPYLGTEHSLGKRILATIDDLTPIELEASSWYRARVPKGPRMMTPPDMGPPAVGSVFAEGRFNHYGQRVFYLASTPAAAVLEVTKGDGGVAWVQQFALPATASTLDLREQPDWLEADRPLLLLGLAREATTRLPDSQTTWRPEYFVARFIADAARAADISAIVFTSPRHSDDNLVLFDWDESRIRPQGYPEVTIAHPDPIDPHPPDY